MSMSGGGRLAAELEGRLAVIPTIKGPAWYPQPVQRFTGWQIGVLDDRDDLELFGCGIPHSCSSPSAIMLFFEQPVFQHQVGNDFLERGGLLAQALDVVGGKGFARSIHRPFLQRPQTPFEP